MRLFTAIQLSKETRDHLAGMKTRWCALPDDAPKCSWVRPENLHVTLRFFGEVPDADVPAICSALAKLQVPGPIRLEPDRIECFPPRGPIRTICVGLSGDLDRVQKLYRGVEECAVMNGFQAEG